MSLPKLEGPLTPRYEMPAGFPPGSIAGRKVEVWAFPRGIRRRVPAWVALWLCAVRRREGPWFEVRLEPGEWPRLYDQAHGLIPVPEPPPMKGSVKTRRRWFQAWLQGINRALEARRLPLKAAYFDCPVPPRLAEAFVAGCRAPVTIGNAAGAERRWDPLTD